MYLLLPQLDDWVLCRVRHKDKGYLLKNLSEYYQENPCELSIPENLPRSEEYRTNTNFQADMITDYQYKDYQIIASILVGGAIPPTENVSSLGKVNFQTTIPSFDSYFNPLKRKSDEDDQHENLISFNSKFNTENKICVSPSKVLTNRELNCYQSQDEIFSGSLSDPSINFQDIKEFTFIGSYPQ